MCSKDYFLAIKKHFAYLANKDKTSLKEFL